MAWQRVQRSVLNRNPLCCDPLGQHAADNRIEPATQVHHIRPLVTHPDLAFDRDNLAAVCTGCHSQIEQRERRGQDTSWLFRAGQVTLGTAKAAEGGTGQLKTRIFVGSDAEGWDEIRLPYDFPSNETQGLKKGEGEGKSLAADAPRPNCECAKKRTEF